MEAEIHCQQQPKARAGSIPDRIEETVWITLAETTGTRLPFQVRPKAYEWAGMHERRCWCSYGQDGALAMARQIILNSHGEDEA
jgi:hypothetical protein